MENPGIKFPQPDEFLVKTIEDQRKLDITVASATKNLQKELNMTDETPQSEGKQGPAQWGETVIVVAPDDVTAIGYINYMEAKPDDQYIYKYVKSSVEIFGMSPPQIARVDYFGQWWRGKPDDFVAEIERIIGECETYRQRLEAQK